MADVKFNTKYDFGNIGGHKRLTYTSWNDGDYKFDIRDWYENGAVGKGMTLTKTELKSLYDLLITMYEKTEDEEEDDFLKEFEVEEEHEPTVPEEIQKKFDIIDTLFKGFKTEKAYGIMEFAKASGERFQYCVTKGKKDFPDYEETLGTLELRSFITDKGNLYVYTL